MKKGKPAQVKSVNTLIAELLSKMSHLVWRERASTGLHVCNSH